MRIAELAKKAGVKRFLFASSCSNYGAAGDAFLTETASFNPVTPYGWSKVNAEKALKTLADDTFCPTYLRASTAYGLSPMIRFDLVVNNLVAWACTTGKVLIKSDGTPWRPLVHVEDIARSYIAALHAPRDIVFNQAFNVGTTTENYQVKEVADLVEEGIEHCQIEYASDAGPDTRCYRVDCNKIALKLHEFKPQWTVKRGITELNDTFSKTNLSLDDFEGSRYKRIAHIQSLISQGILNDELRFNSSI